MENDAAGLQGTELKILGFFHAIMILLEVTVLHVCRLLYLLLNIFIAH